MTTLATLAEARRWVAWQTEGRGPAGKPTKVPYAPKGGKAKADDPRTWGTRGEAEKRASVLPKPFGMAGVGIELGDHEELALGGIDLDTCCGPDGRERWASEVITRLGSYTEKSPSGTGAKILFRYERAELPTLRRLMQTEHGKQWKRATGDDHPPAIELYLSNRYFAVTDEQVEGTPPELRVVPGDDIAWLIETAGPQFAASGARTKNAKSSAGDGSRSAAAFKIAAGVKRAGGSYESYKAALATDPATSTWLAEKGLADGERQVKRAWARASDATADDVLLTEHGVALAFRDHHRDRLRFCHDTGAWFIWTGTTWEQDRKHAAFSFARDLVAAANGAAEFKTQAITGKASFAGGVERFARADPVLAVTAEAWNPNPWLLGTPGGVVDLQTGKLRPARHADMITRSTSVAPAETSDAPTWRAFLLEATNNDLDLIRFLKRWCGYCLTGLTREHALLFIYGPGGNGKSVFLNTVTGILGAYHATAAMDTFTDGGGSRHLAFLAMLAGARMVTAAETEEGRPWAETKIKEMTGGTPITANFMRQNPFTFTPEFKITITGNHKPVLRNVDDAVRRRFNILPFTHKPAQPDRRLEDKLRAEWPAILRWMIDGCVSWAEGGLPRPKVVSDATAEYFAAQDALGQWLAERCVMEGSLAEKPGKLLADLNAWLTKNGEQPTNRNRFRGWAERQPGLRYKTVRGSEYVGGIGLRPPHEGQGGDGWQREQ